MQQTAAGERQQQFPGETALGAMADRTTPSGVSDRACKREPAASAGCGSAPVGQCLRRQHLPVHTLPGVKQASDTPDISYSHVAWAE